MDKSKYKEDKKEISASQKHLKSVYKSERTPKKEVIKAVITKTGKKVFHTREEIIKLRKEFNFLISSLREKLLIQNIILIYGESLKLYSKI